MDGWTVKRRLTLGIQTVAEKAKINSVRSAPPKLVVHVDIFDEAAMKCPVEHVLCERNRPSFEV
jgi:hypothetical protein